MLIGGPSGPVEQKAEAMWALPDYSNIQEEVECLSNPLEDERSRKSKKKSPPTA